MSYPTHVPAPYGAVVHQNQTLSYEFRVVEHENDEGKVTAYIMQTQIWAHNPPDHNGYRGNPMLVQDWTDVPRVRMPANSTGSVSEYMKDMAEMLEEDDEYLQGVKP